MFKTLYPELNVKPITIKIFNENKNGMPVVIAPGFFTDGDEEWVEKLIKIIDSPIVFVQWRSSNFSKLMMEFIPQIITSAVLPYKAAMIPLSIGKGFFRKWRECSELANQVGERLANFLNDVWDKDEKALFIGHSLGVRIITEAMKNLEYSNVFASISIAGAILKDRYEDNIMQARCIDGTMHVNLYSDSDYVLQYLYRVGEVDLKNKPIGMTESDLSHVENINLSLGHTSYLTSEEFLKYIAMYYREKRSEYYARCFNIN
ncbi:DUF726 domain-containing protein [Serratia fonticola]|uniref:DUF726 domain-containing protein n=1 Tax=Serratia fonticola TaxID=47917 RepID=UPI0034C6D0A4